jgi:hypothetical protein
MRAAMLDGVPAWASAALGAIASRQSEIAGRMS